MSHIVAIQTQIRDPAALAAACRQLGLAEPVVGAARLYSGTATGLIVRLRGCLLGARSDRNTKRTRSANAAANGD